MTLLDFGLFLARALLAQERLERYFSLLDTDDD